MRRRFIQTKQTKIGADNLTLKFAQLLKKLSKHLADFYMGNGYNANIWTDTKKAGLYATNGHLALRLPLPRNVGSGSFSAKELFDWFSARLKFKAIKTDDGEDSFSFEPPSLTARPLSKSKVPDLQTLFAADFSAMQDDGKYTSASINISLLKQALEVGIAAGMGTVKLVLMADPVRPIYILDARTYDPEGRNLVAAVQNPETEAAAGIIAVAQVRDCKTPFDDYGKEQAGGL